MRITDVSILIHERPWHLKGFLSSSGKLPFHVLTIETDEGVTGNTFISGPAGDAPGQIIRMLKPMLLGRNPLDIGAIWHDMWRRNRMLAPMAMGCVDVALWDIAGKVAGLPVHRMLGTVKEKVPVYFSAFQHARAQDFADEAKHWQAQGWRGYKLHPPTQRRMFGEDASIRDDIAACEAIRSAVGEEMVLMLDPACAYDYGDALVVGRAVEGLDYAWIEDPLPADDLYGYTRLKQKLTIPIVATEMTAGGLYAFPYWITERATDALRGDVAVKGGITGMMKIAHLAEAFHLPLEVHDAYNGANNVATLHVIAACGNASWFEVIPFNEAGQTGVDKFWYGLAEAPRIDTDGFAHVPQQPGLGLVIDWDLLESAVIGKLT